MKFSDDYPNKAPDVRFITNMFHPNIYGDGHICIDILQDQWSPIYNVSSILTSLQILMNDPNPHSPANSEAAKLFQENIKEYERRVKECVEESLNDGDDDDDDEDMEDDEEEAKEEVDDE